MHTSIAIVIPIIQLRATRLMKRLIEDPRIDTNTKYEIKSELSEILFQSQSLLSDTEKDLEEKLVDCKKWILRGGIPEALKVLKNIAMFTRSGNDLLWVGVCPHKNLRERYNDCHACASCSWKGYDDYNWWNHIATTPLAKERAIRCNETTTRRFTIDFKTGEFEVALEEI